jgi:hypothetical protein
MFEPSSFTALFGDSAYPTMTGIRDAMGEVLMRTVPELSITDGQVEKLLRTKFGSTRGVTDTDRISVTLFAQKKTAPESNITDFIIMFSRFSVTACMLCTETVPNSPWTCWAPQSPVLSIPSRATTRAQPHSAYHLPLTS